jgi:hypothetical protein
MISSSLFSFFRLSSNLFFQSIAQYQMEQYTLLLSCGYLFVSYVHVWLFLFSLYVFCKDCSPFYFIFKLITNSVTSSPNFYVTRHIISKRSLKLLYLIVLLTQEAHTECSLVDDNANI